jgi:iron complex outermembrane receptor protein
VRSANGLQAGGLALAAALAAGAAAAAEPARLPEVTVSATRVEHDSFDLPVAIDSVPQRTIREDQPMVNLSEALGRVPGIVVQNRHNYAQDLQISSRGFGARSTFGVRGLRLVADGIPATMPDGQGQAATFSLGSAERIEVLRGPFSSLYGNAAGGVVQIFTADGPPQPTLGAGLFAGSHGFRRLAAQFGGTRGAANALADVSRFETSGYRDHSAARRDHFNAKLKLEGAGPGVATLVLNVLDQPETQDPLGLTASQFAENPRQAGTNAIAFDTRKSVEQNQLGLTYDLPLSAQTRLQARVYYGERRVVQFLAIPLAAQLAATASGGVVDLNRGYGGAGLRWTRAFSALGAPATASVGFDYDRMAERRRGFVNQFGVAGALKRDEDDVVSNGDLYGQLEWRLGERLNLLAGVRTSRVRFRSADYFVAPGNPDDSGAVRYARTTPAVGASFALSPAATLYANYGEGFETPTFAELAHRAGGASGLNFALKPARSTHRELGAKLLLGAAGRLAAALFRVDVLDEIVVESSSGGRTVFKNAAATWREGFELSWQSRLPGGFEAALAWTLLDARFTQPFASGTPPVTVAAGNRLPGVAPATFFGELLWREPASGFHAGVELRYSGRIPVNDANSQAAGSYAVWNARAGFEQRGRTWRLTEFVRLDNLGDRRYAGSVIVNEANGRFYEPAPGRNGLVGVNASLAF